MTRGLRHFQPSTRRRKRKHLLKEAVSSSNERQATDTRLITYRYGTKISFFVSHPEDDSFDRWFFFLEWRVSGGHHVIIRAIHPITENRKTPLGHSIRFLWPSFETWITQRSNLKLQISLWDLCSTAIHHHSSLNSLSKNHRQGEEKLWWNVSCVQPVFSPLVCSVFWDTP